jgi:acetylornithine deacetylase/succinyl-diaminopimelate desuccinylase-like protein
VNTTDGDEHRLHGIDERLSIDDLARAVCTYQRIMQLMSSA